MDQGKGRQLPRERQQEQEKAAKAGRRYTAVAAKVLLVPLLLFVSLVAGLVIGYGVLGKSPVAEVFDPRTYKHMYDLIFAGTEEAK